ncbi:MAG: glycosyltransferase, partial [Burkholderiales bacterium]|nr:glycosyltransferase [Burkholderiales bacterium]
YQPLKNQFLKRVNRIVATSPNYLATSPTLAQFKDKTEIITYGLDSQIYPVANAPDLEKWRARFPQPFFLFVGMLRYYKGLHILLEAAKGTDLPVVILGDGPVEAELKQQAHSLGLRNVHFLGALPENDKVALLSLCYALAFPSHLRSEAFGITLLEAAMFGKPMISCEIGTGTSYVNQDQETGLVVPASDPQAFRLAMQTLAANPQRAQEMGRKAALRYEELFTAERMAKKYQDLYQRVLNRA